MSSNLDGYKQRVTDIVSRAHMMRATLLDPILDDSGKFLADGNARGERLKAAVPNSVYESAGEDAPMILGAHSRALQAFCQRYGRLPNDEILASAHKAIENALQIGKGKGLPGVFESADMSTTEGIMMRDRMVSLVLPVLLQSVTAQMTTLIPGQFNRSEMFRVYRVAGSSFGDLKAGDRIDYRYNGRHAVMDQMSPAYLGDASKTQFVFYSATDCGQRSAVDLARNASPSSMLASNLSLPLAGDVLFVWLRKGLERPDVQFDDEVTGLEHPFHGKLGIFGATEMAVEPRPYFRPRLSLHTGRLA